MKRPVPGSMSRSGSAPGARCVTQMIASPWVMATGPGEESISAGGPSACIRFADIRTTAGRVPPSPATNRYRPAAARETGRRTGAGNVVARRPALTRLPGSRSGADRTSSVGARLAGSPPFEPQLASDEAINQRARILRRDGAIAPSRFIVLIARDTQRSLARGPAGRLARRHVVEVADIDVHGPGHLVREPVRHDRALLDALVAGDEHLFAGGQPVEEDVGG